MATVGNIGEETRKRNILATAGNYGGYRQFLQALANLGDNTVSHEASALLQRVGDDGKMGGDTGSKLTFSQVNPVGSGQNLGYDQRGIDTINSEYWTAFANSRPQYQASNATGGGGGQVDPDAARRASLRNALTGRRGDVESAYEALFGDLGKLIQSRTGDLETQYGDQLKKASDQYAAALPEIENSYSSLGAANSTDLRDAHIDAQKGYDDTVADIGKNKTKDQAALGQYDKETRARFQADKDAALRAIDSSADTTDVNALQGLSNQLDTNLSGVNVSRATLGTDGEAARHIQGLTSDNGRFQAAIDALDGIMKSSMASDVKQAAVKAVTDAGGLSDQEKKKVQAQYGNVYAEQATL